MSKTAQISAIFDEVSDIAGDALSERQSLVLAAELVDRWGGDHISPALNAATFETQPSYVWPLDTMFADGGWRNLCRLDADAMSYEERDKRELRTHLGLLRFQQEYCA